MKASEARTVADEKHYLRQIRNEALQGKIVTVLEFVGRQDAEAARLHLTGLGYECSKIKEHRDVHGDDFTMAVAW